MGHVVTCPLPPSVVDKPLPRQIQSMCLAEFAATYATNYQHSNDNECDALPASENDTTSTQMKPTDGFGKMNKRTRSCGKV